MDKLVFVHLSDIHFTGSSGADIFDLDTDVRNELLLDVVRVVDERGGATGVLVTGDVAYSGKPEQYARASSWLLEFCQAIGCSDENVMVVPGNHDVDQNIAALKFTKTMQETIRAKPLSHLDQEIHEILSDEQLGTALFAPLAEYNRFAARFQCSLSPQMPYWERDMQLPCGTPFRLRGLCSTLVSNKADEKGNMVLGTSQVNAPRIPGVEYITLCHHPPDWLRDQDTVDDFLVSRIRIQLFGHKHSQRVHEINGKLRITAGAMHPERKGKDWEPTYNVIEIERRDDSRIGCRIFQRQWNKAGTCFVALHDENTGKEFRDFVWDSTRPEVQRQPTFAPPIVTQSPPADLMSVDGQTIQPNPDSVPQQPQRRLAYRFLTLPFRKQMAIAQTLGLLTDDDREMSDEVLYRELFKRAFHNRLLPKLWDETEKYHEDASTSNPFNN